MEICHQLLGLNSLLSLFLVVVDYDCFGLEFKKFFVEQRLSLVVQKVLQDVAAELKITLLVGDVAVLAPGDNLQLLQKIKQRLFFHTLAASAITVIGIYPAQRCRSQAP